MLEPFDTIEAHHFLDFGTESLIEPTIAVADTAPALPVFDLERMWHRGRFRPSLLADSPELSELWRAQYADEGLPLLPDVRETARIAGNPWRWLARENGREECNLQRRSGLPKSEFMQLSQIAEQQDVLFPLPLWQPPGENAVPDRLLYWSDSGALHLQLGLTERLLLNWDKRHPDGPTPAELRRLKKPRETSWEGFAISCPLRAAGIRAKGNVWRAPDGEIDLVLIWPETGSVWAVEVSLGRKKRLTPHFDHGCNLIQAGRGIIVFNENVGKPKIVWPKNFSRVVEVMTLREALREVRAGP